MGARVPRWLGKVLEVHPSVSTTGMLIVWQDSKITNMHGKTIPRPAFLKCDKPLWLKARRSMIGVGPPSSGHTSASMLHYYQPLDLLV